MAAPRIHFVPSGRRVALRPGASLLEAVAEAGLPLARGCGGDGLCARCGVQILEGSDHLPPESAAELRAKRRNRTAPGLRLACRVVPTGPLRVTAPGWAAGGEDGSGPPPGCVPTPPGRVPKGRAGPETGRPSAPQEGSTC